MTHEVAVFETARELGGFGADLVDGMRGAGELSVLGVATGDSPLPVYEALSARAPLGPLAVFALDEYVGVAPDDPASYHAVVDATVTRPLRLDPARVFVPDGMAEDLDRAAAEFEKRIEAHGGIDLQILGIGGNGHIGFNEPGSGVDSRSRVVALAEQTRADNSRFFDTPDQVPTHAVTQGIATIMSARRLLLVARGAAKAAAVVRALRGAVDPGFPASILQRHPRVTVLLDRDAARELPRDDIRFLSRRQPGSAGQNSLSTSGSGSAR